MRDQDKKRNIQQLDQWTYTEEIGQMLYIDRDYVTYSSNAEEYDEIIETFLESFHNCVAEEGGQFL